MGRRPSTQGRRSSARGLHKISSSLFRGKTDWNYSPKSVILKKGTTEHGSSLDRGISLENRPVSENTGYWSHESKESRSDEAPHRSNHSLLGPSYLLSRKTGSTPIITTRESSPPLPSATDNEKAAATGTRVPVFQMLQWDSGRTVYRREGQASSIDEEPNTNAQQQFLLASAVPRNRLSPKPTPPEALPSTPRRSFSTTATRLSKRTPGNTLITSKSFNSSDAGKVILHSSGNHILAPPSAPSSRRGSATNSAEVKDPPRTPSSILRYLRNGSMALRSPKPSQLADSPSLESSPKRTTPRDRSVAPWDSPPVSRKGSRALAESPTPRRGLATLSSGRKYSSMLQGRSRRTLVDKIGQTQ